MSSFNALITEHREYLFGLAMRFTRDHAAADDLVQDTMVRAIRFQHGYHEGTNLKAWMSTILVRQFYSVYKRQKMELAYIEQQRVAVDEEVNEEQQVDLNEAGFKDTLSDESLAALNSLSDMHRTMVVMSDINGCSYNEIATAVGCPVGTVMSRLHRGRQSFRKNYKTL